MRDRPRQRGNQGIVPDPLRPVIGVVLLWLAGLVFCQITEKKIEPEDEEEDPGYDVSSATLVSVRILGGWEAGKTYT